jgi:short-subunit dehydrogenase
MLPAEETTPMSTRPGDGQTALVTGSSGGIGVDLAECFARDGYDLVLTARSKEALENVAARLSRAYGVKAAAITGDLGEWNGGQKLAETIAARGLTVDVLVNNAGYGQAGALTASDRATQLGMIDLNVRALVELTHIYWDGMRARGRGGVLNVASTAAFQPGPLMAVYYASKAFVLSFSEALWEEARGTGLRVSCLCPGPTVSNFRARAGTDKTKLSAASAQMPSMPVAEAGYRAWCDNRRVVVTGLRNRLMAAAIPFAPRSLVLRTVRRLQSPKA